MTLLSEPLSMQFDSAVALTWHFCWGGRLRRLGVAHILLRYFPALLRAHGTDPVAMLKVVTSLHVQL